MIETICARELVETLWPLLNIFPILRWLKLSSSIRVKLGEIIRIDAGINIGASVPAKSL
ncbi:MAG: hypothetical protein WDA09_05425 [Bacteriovoracaceae bacterium]